MQWRMIAIDIDGTLLDADGQLPDENRRAVHKARDAGCMVVLCTGRGLVESRHVAAELDHDGPMVLACGAHIACPTSGRTLHRRKLGPELAHELVHHFDHDEHAVLVMPDPEPSEHDYLIVGHENMTANTKWWFSRINANLHLENAPSIDHLEHALRVAIVGPPDIMPPIESSLLERFGAQIEVQHFAAIKENQEVLHLLEVFAAGVNKWSGLQWLAAEHDIASEQIATIGDQINDVHMVRHAGIGIAMANGHPDVHAVADRVTASNCEGGVAQAIDHLLDGRW